MLTLIKIKIIDKVSPFVIIYLRFKKGFYFMGIVLMFKN